MLPPNLAVVKTQLDELVATGKISPELQMLQAELSAVDHVLDIAGQQNITIRNLILESLSKGFYLLGPTPGICPGCGRTLKD
mgnify:CR=1 FL=1